MSTRLNTIQMQSLDGTSQEMSSFDYAGYNVDENDGTPPLDGKVVVQDAQYLDELYISATRRPTSLCGHLRQFTLHNRVDISLLFEAISEGSLEAVKRLLLSNRIDLCTRGPHGESVLHHALLVDRDDIALFLADCDRRLVNMEMTSSLYLGESPVHIAIMNNNETMVEELINRGADVQKPRACGTFFLPGKDCKCYYGEYPLSFAVCQGLKKTVELLVQRGASLRARDRFGNTPVHMLTTIANTKRAKEMYDFIMNMDAEGRMSLSHLRNGMGMTPMSLAVKKRNIEIFEHMMSRKRTFLWNYGTTTCYAYDLEEVDTLQNNSIIKDIASNLRNDFRLFSAFVNVSPLKELLEWKRSRYIQKWWLFSTVMYLIYVVILTAVLYNQPMTPVYHVNASSSSQALKMESVSVQDAYETTSDYVRMSGEIFVILATLVMTTFEIIDICKLRVKVYLGQSAIAFHLLAWCVINSVLLQPFFRVSRLSQEVISACALLFGWFYCMFFARGYKCTGPFIFMIQSILVKDITKFFMVYFICLTGFSLAIHMMYYPIPDYCMPREMASLGSTAVFLNSAMLGLVQLDIFDDPTTSSFTKALIYAYLIIAYVLMLNMLIVMMGSSYSAIFNDWNHLWSMQKVLTTLVVERRGPKCFFPKAGINGVVIGLNPKKQYIRVEVTDEEHSKIHRSIPHHFITGRLM
ncbi:transient receptor potential cation channel subfamily V member 6-like [Saccoglossus kowalevskii]|uniref:Transient receptor potential cation channel subfamily V member 6-like n=1 Tax=Saccoglossus kowalevskii TaxID=10224 RepID=A0ABM0MPW2_SACKO|nr:PREDICTED: transient receptor potential cation channel subfamily V member 6-like [Saccoglossus kowalevskii]